MIWFKENSGIYIPQSEIPATPLVIAY